MSYGKEHKPLTLIVGGTMKSFTDADNHPEVNLSKLQCQFLPSRSVCCVLSLTVTDFII
jgi:hypothetical protein